MNPLLIAIAFVVGLVGLVMLLLALLVANLAVDAAGDRLVDWADRNPRASNAGGYLLIVAFLALVALAVVGLGLAILDGVGVPV